MNQGQNQFFNFILERVNDEDVDKAKELLEESFSKQADGTFDLEYINEFNKKLTPLVKPQHKEEVENILKGFAQKFK